MTDRYCDTPTIRLVSTRSVKQPEPVLMSQRAENSNHASIAVLGATGSGKSSFINLASGSRLPVSHSLESCTQEVLVSPKFDLDGRTVSLIDTPGFDDTKKTDAEIVQIIAAFLETYYRSGKLLHGVVYLHRISDNRMNGALRKSFGLFTKLCGDNALRNAVIVTNMWSEISTQEKGNDRQRQLETDDQFFKPALDLGATITRHDNTRGSALRIVRGALNNLPMPLGIQRELVDSRKHFSETEVAQEVELGLQALVRNQTVEVKKLKAKIEEAERTNDQQTARGLEAEWRQATALLIKIQKLSSNLTTDYRKKLKASKKCSGDFEDEPEALRCGCIVV